MPPQTPLAERFRAYRKQAGLSQDDAARSIGVGYNTLRTWEHATVPAATNLPAIARAYGCTVDELLDCSPTPGRVLVDQELARKILSLTKEDGEKGLQAIVDKHGPGTPFNWLAVVPDGAVCSEFRVSGLNRWRASVVT